MDHSLGRSGTAALNKWLEAPRKELLPQLKDFQGEAVLGPLHGTLHLVFWPPVHWLHRPSISPADFNLVSSSSPFSKEISKAPHSFHVIPLFLDEGEKEIGGQKGVETDKQTGCQVPLLSGSGI